MKPLTSILLLQNKSSKEVREMPRRVHAHSTEGSLRNWASLSSASAENSTFPMCRSADITRRILMASLPNSRAFIALRNEERAALVSSPSIDRQPDLLRYEYYSHEFTFGFNRAVVVTLEASEMLKSDFKRAGAPPVK